MPSVSDVIDFVNDIPAGTNPFLATATLMNNLLNTPQAPGWSRALTRLTLVTFGIMFVQSIFLLYQRLRIKEFMTPKFNKLGLLAISVCDVSAIAYTIFCSLTIVFLSMQVPVENGERDDKSWFIFGVKYLAISLCADAYLWGCACSCAVVAFDTKFITSLSSTSRARLRFATKCALYISFLAGLSARTSLVLWYYSTAYLDLRKIIIIIDEIRENLISAASTYDAQTYTKVETLKILIPAQELVPLSDDMGDCIFKGNRVFLLSCVLTCLIYIPLMSYYLRGLYKQNISQSALEAAGGQGDKQSLPKRSLNIRHERRRVVYHGLAVYLSTAINIPALLWQYYNTQAQFQLDLTWREVTYHGLSVPFSFTGNIVVFILILHSRKTLIKIAEMDRNPTESSEPPHKFIQRLDVVFSKSSRACIESNTSLDLNSNDAHLSSEKMSTCAQNGSCYSTPQ